MKKLLAYVMALCAGLFSHPQLVSEIAVLFLVVLVWVAGPWVGIETVDARMQIIVGIVALRAVTHVVRHVLAQKRAKQFEAALRSDAQGGRSDKEEKLEAVRIQFEKGIEALKRSKLARGLKGNTALYDLPWIVFIGPSNTGKTTALRNSGLQFPVLSEFGKGLKGVGGTRNCDWWFTNAGVLLDTAGRYMNQTDDDSAEWGEFLNLLLKYRNKKPINGVIVAISMADIMQGSDEHIEEHAKQIRARIDELIKRLGVVFPVYVMFTKCDLAKGFVEFFDELNKAERERVWGCTFPKAGHGNESLVTRFKTELNELLSVLHERRLMRLSTSRGTQKLSIMGFPMQLASVNDRLTQFIDTLFHVNAYQENPFFRGFYFSSGTQEGSPIDRVFMKVAGASGLSGDSFSALSKTEPKSYFLKELFLGIIFPDQHLVTPSSAMYRQRGYLRVAMFALAVVGMGLAIAGLGLSFFENQRVLSDIKSASLQRQDVSRNPTQFAKNITSISELGRHLTSIFEYREQGIPFRLAVFYQGDRIREKMGDLYFQRFRGVFLSETIRDMERRLTELKALSSDISAEGREYDEHYSLLKTYLMLNDPSYLKPQYLNEWLNTFWIEKLRRTFSEEDIRNELEPRVLEQMALYSNHIASKRRLALKGQLIRDVQERLKKVPPVQRVYALSRREAEKVVKPITVDQILQGVAQGSITSDYAVPGTCTLEGWKGPFQDSVAKVLRESGDEGWVIDEPNMDRSQLANGIKRQHVLDCVQQWRGFLQSLRIKAVVTPSNVEEELGLLASVDSPIQQIMDAVVRNTVQDTEEPSKAQGRVTEIVDWGKKKLGMGEPGEAVAMSSQDTEEVVRRLSDPTDFSKALSLRFKGLQQLIQAPKDGKEDAPLTRYLTEMRKVYQTVRSPLRAADSPAEDIRTLAKAIVAGEPNDILQARKNTDAMLVNLTLELRTVIEPLMVEPWMMTARGVLERAKTEIEKRWVAGVYPACSRVKDWYPFRQGGDDVPIAEFVEMFHPENGLLWRFHQAELKPFLTEGIGRSGVKEWKGISLQLSDKFLASLDHAHMLSQSLFPRGSADPNVAFEVSSPSYEGKNVSEIRLEVGGQVNRYRNEPPGVEGMKWPGPTPAAGAALKVQIGGTWVFQKEIENVWGLFHLIDLGRLKPKTDVPSQDDFTHYLLEWDVPASDGQHVKVQYDLKTPSYKNPFRPGIFTQFRCVEQL